MNEFVAENLKTVRANIEKAAKVSGRTSDDITLVAVSKTVDCDVMEIALHNGVKNFGENKVQELTRKIEYFQNRIPPDFKWHQIGRLQTNKVKYLIGKDILIHSVDREDLLKEISTQSVKKNVSTDILIQVNISGEQSKAGINPNEIDGFLELACKQKGIIVRGVMTMAPNTNNSDEIRTVFSEMNKIFVDKKKLTYDNILYMDFLSMGMSNDYEIAIEEGANLVRVGTSIFGRRSYDFI